MRKFLAKLVIFAAIGFALLNIVAVAILSSDNLLSQRLSWFRVHQRVLASRQEIDADTVILGDSVAGQFFPFGGQPNSITSNGSILMLGHYVLAANVLEANPGIRRVVVLSVPQILGSSIERRKTFNNVVLPFLTFRHLRHFSPLARSKLACRPLSGLYVFPGAKLLPVSDIDFSDGSRPREDVLSDIAVDYLHRLRGLCAGRGVELRLVSPPVESRWREKTGHWRDMRRQIGDEALDSVFDGYFDAILYVPKEQFRDAVHLTPSAVEKNRDRVVRRVLTGRRSGPVR